MRQVWQVKPVQGIGSQKGEEPKGPSGENKGETLNEHSPLVISKGKEK